MNLVTGGVAGAIVNGVSDLIDRFIPNKTEAQAAQLELLRMMQQGEIDNAIKQIEVNIQEAQNPNLFVSGWRPFIGWQGGFSIFYGVMGHNFLGWVSVINKWPPPPAIDLELIVWLVCGLLGIGAA